MILLEIAVAMGLFGLLFLAWLLGKRLAAKMPGSLASHPQFGVVQGAILAILGLILGFSFAGAISRAADREEVLSQEANAIIALHDVLALLAPEPRDRARAVLREYVRLRQELFTLNRFDDDRPIRVRLAAHQAVIWSTIVDALSDVPASTEIVSQAYLDFVKAFGARNAVNARHVPALVLAVLVACAFASIASVGMGVEITDQQLRRPALILIFLVATTLWLTFDIDSAHLGVIRISPQPLEDAAAYLATAGRGESVAR